MPIAIAAFSLSLLAMTFAISGLMFGRLGANILGGVYPHFPSGAVTFLISGLVMVAIARRDFLSSVFASMAVSVFLVLMAISSAFSEGAAWEAVMPQYPLVGAAGLLLCGWFLFRSREKHPKVRVTLNYKVTAATFLMSFMLAILFRAHRGDWLYFWSPVDYESAQQFFVFFGAALPSAILCIILGSAVLAPDQTGK